MKARPNRAAPSMSQAAPAQLQLAVSLQHGAAAVPDAKSLHRQRVAAAKQIAPGHAGGAVAEFRGGGPTWGQFAEVHGAGSRARQPENNERYGQFFH